MKLRILGVFLLILGFVFFLDFFPGITGFVIVEEINKNILGFLALVFIFVGVLILIKVGGLERKILSKKELPDLTPKERAFRKKLINLFDRQKLIEPKKIAYFLPRYEKIRNTKEHIPGYNYTVYLGKRGNKEEYFSVDTREMVEFKIGDRHFLLPTHIDVQERLGVNQYKKTRREEIDWNKLLRYSDDILKYFRRRK